jgi:hypothetical protein
MKKILALAFLLIGSTALSTMAATANPTKANGDFISGSGIPSDQFTVGVAANGESVQLKARSADTGSPISLAGNVYTVLAGNSVDFPGTPAWRFDYQFSPGTLPPVTPDQYILTLNVDFDPGVGTTDFATISLPIGDGDTSPLNSWDDGDGFFTNPGSNAWSDNATPYVVSNSWHNGFAFWNTLFGKSYDPNALGEYQIDLSVAYASNPSLPVASSSILVNVVPEPSSMALLGLGLVGLTVAAWRKRRAV